MILNLVEGSYSSGSSGASISLNARHDENRLVLDLLLSSTKMSKEEQ